MRAARDPAGEKLARCRPRLRAAQGSESAPFLEPSPELEALFDEAIALFGPRYGRAMSREEARQMIERLTAFVDLLAEWQDHAQDGPDEGEVAA
jgi:hypothetical protein